MCSLGKRTWFAVMLALGLGVAGCFNPSYPDGEIACGESGCPPGMSCGSDGLCYLDPPGDTPPDGTGDPGLPNGTTLALAVGNDNGVDVLAMCNGQLERVWRTGGNNGQSAVESRQVAWGDSDGDGIPELAVANMRGGARIYELSSDGFDEIWENNDQRQTRAIALADIDGDGRDDLILGFDGGEVTYYHSQPNGQRFDEVWSSSGLTGTWELAVADFDLDGDLDIAVATKGQSDRVYRNVGGNQLSLVWSSTTAEETEAVAWGDVDGDGFPEITTGGSGSRARIYRFNGTTFVSHWESTFVEDIEAIAWEDFDLDGDVDLTVGNWEQPDRVYRNEAGQLVSAWTSDTPADAPTGLTESVDWADVDGDGDADLMIGKHEAANILLRNDGGTLVQAWRASYSDSTRDVVWHSWETPSGLPGLCSLVP